MIICILQIWTKRIVKKSFFVFSLILRLDNSCEVCQACRQNIKIFKHNLTQPSVMNEHMNFMKAVKFSQQLPL